MNAPWKIHRKARTESTNDDAKRGVAWDVFTAERQTAGRGRLDHRWHSGEGENLVMSAVIPVGGLAPDHAATLPLAVGLAVAEGAARLLGAAASPAAAGVALKWPNDVLAAGRKIAGILCERHGDLVVAGIGMNVGARRFPDELADRAASLATLGASATVDDALGAVLDALAAVCGEWRTGGLAALLPRIAAMDALKGRWVSVRQTDADASPVEGVCGGVQSDGSLLVGSAHVWAGEAHVEKVGE